MKDALKRNAEDKAIQKAVEQENDAIDAATTAAPAESTGTEGYAPAAAGKLYDALAEKGRVATQGITFDTGSDQIRPENLPAT